MNSQSECLRCSRDKQVPKLYSAENNMHPGPTPTELQISVLKLYLAIIIKTISTAGIDSGGRDAHFSSDASDVHLCTTDSEKPDFARHNCAKRSTP